MLCPKCRTSNRDGSRFCVRCGYQFYAELVNMSGVAMPVSMSGNADDEVDITKAPTEPLSQERKRRQPQSRRPQDGSQGVSMTQSSITEIQRSREQAELPYLHIIQTNDLWNVYFAIRLVAVTKGESAGGKGMSEGDMLHQQFSFLAAITEDSLEIQKVIELRYVSHPDQELPQRGKLNVGFICKVVHPDRDLAIQLADTFRIDTYAMLPLTDTQTYQFVVAYSEQEFVTLFNPFPVRDIGEIVKREELVNIGKERELYVAYPFSGNIEPSMSRVLWKLLREQSKHLLSICLMPTSLSPWEKQMLRESVDACESTQTETEFEQGTGDGRLKGTTRYSARARASALGRIIQGHFHELSDKAWLLKIQIASDYTLNQGVLDIIGLEFAGFPRYDFEKGAFKSGGYEVERPATVEEYHVAERNLQYLEFIPWLYSIAPDQLTRLRSLVTIDEAFKAFRLPLPKEEGVPGVELQTVKYSPIPSNMPAEGITLGESLYIGLRRPPRVMIKDEDRQRHMYIVGKTGVGKSTLILQMAMADIRRGLGVCVVDPHGELINDTLLRLPRERIKDIILFDPSDTERPLGVNMMEAETEEEKHLIVNEMIGLMYKLYDPNKIGIVGPRFEHAVRNSMLTVMAEPGSTLIDVVGVLTSAQFRSAKLKYVTDPLVRSYWEDQIANTSDFHKSEVLDYIVSKFGRFVTNDLVRNIIGQSKSSFDFRKVIDERRILLVNLAKGKVGEENSNFLGLILIPKILVAAMSRQNIPQ